MRILDWNIQGVIPPVISGFPGNKEDHSPYKIELIYLINRLAFSVERRKILYGFL